MSQKVSLDVLVDSLLEESSRKFQETLGLKWEWEHYTKLYELVTLIKEKEFARDNNISSKRLASQSQSQNLIEDEAETQQQDKNHVNGDGNENNTSQSHDMESSISSSSSSLSSLSLTADHNPEEERQRREKAFPAFLKWLKDNGVDCDKIEINYFGDSGFGIKAKVPLKVGEIVFQVPENIILTSLKSKESKLKLIAEKDPILRSMQNVAIAMFLVLEKYSKFASESFWSPYIATLPLTYDTVLYFSKNEMELLKFSPSAFREALKMYRNVTRQYAYFHIKFKKANDQTSKTFRSVLTFNRYVWGVSSVTTRINHLPDSSGDGSEPEIMSMIPLWDMCNHEEELRQVSTDFDATTKKLICYSPTSYAKGCEFKIFYGNRSSTEYLVHNGFVPKGYRDDTYYLELGIGINDNCYARKKAVLGHVGLNCQNIFLVKPNRLMSSKGLFLFVRVFLADKDGMEKIESDVDNLSALNEPTEQSLNFLITRFTLLKRSVENAKKNVTRASSTSAQENVSLSDTRVNMIIKVLTNEETVLEMLISSTKNQLNELKNKSI